MCFISVMSLGYSPAEARLGLRSSYGDVEMAVNYILNKRIASAISTVVDKISVVVVVMFLSDGKVMLIGERRVIEEGKPGTKET